MNKIVSMLIMGLLMALFPIIIVFIGVKHNYFDALAITVFYNHIFFESFPLVIYLVLASVLGVLYVLVKDIRYAAIVTIGVLLVSMLSLIPSLGFELGQKMYETSQFTVKDKIFTYKGVLQYESVNFYYLLDDDANRTIKFNKGDVNEAY